MTKELEWLRCLKLRTDISLGEDGYKYLDNIILKLTNLPKDTCDVCWTSSWTPCQKDYPNAQKVKGKSDWVLCQMCEADRKIRELTTKAELNEKEVEKILSDYDQTLIASSQRTFKGYAHAICSHFSKTIKYPEKKGILSSNDFNTMSDEAYSLKQERNIGYNQALNDTRKLNGEGGV